MSEAMHISEAAKKIRGSIMFQFMEKAKRLEREGKKIYHFEIGDTDQDTPESIRTAAIDSLKSGETHYASSAGLLELREAVREEVRKSLGYKPDLQQVIIAPAKSLIYFVLRAVMDPGDEIIVPDPGFAPYFSMFDFIGLKWVPVKLSEEDDFAMLADNVSEKINSKTKLMIVNSPHNPTGAVMKESQLSDLAQLAEEQSIYLLSDEVYSKQIYQGRHHSPTVYDACDKYSILINSFSKNYSMTGFRLGWAVVPEHLSKKMKLIMQTIISSVPEFIQRAGIEALKGDQSFIKERTQLFQQRRDEMVRLLNKIPGISCVTPGGAFYVFANITETGMSSEEFAEFAVEKAGVVLLPGTVFGENGEGYVRLAFGTSLENIKEGLTKLKKALV